MVEHAGLIAYLWFISENIRDLISFLVGVSGVGLSMMYIGNSISTESINWTVVKEEDLENNYRKKYYESIIKLRSTLFKYTKIYMLIVFLMMFIPTRNQLVVIFSAEPILKTGMNLSKQVKDSNVTKSIGNILSNSLTYLENRTKTLSEVKGK